MSLPASVRLGDTPAFWEPPGVRVGAVVALPAPLPAAAPAAFPPAAPPAAGPLPAA
jgi:hypothetical protein